MRLVNQEKYYEKIKDLNIAHYSGEVPYYSKASFRHVERKLLDNLKPNAKILDLGCGSGRFSVSAALMGFNITGVDITLKAIEAARKRAQNLKLNNVNFVVGDMTNLPFNDESFDYVFCPRFSINAVATFNRREMAVKEMLRAIKNNGFVFIESFNRFYLGKGLFFLIKNIIRDIKRYIIMFCFLIFRKEYKGLLPGDIIYPSNKVSIASEGYAHLPTFFELRRLVPQKTEYEFYSIPQIMENKKFDIFKYFRYSIWLIISKR